MLINNTKVLLPQAYVTLADFYVLLRPFGFIPPQNFKLFGFRIWAYLMKVIPEARRAHWIWYLRLYYRCLQIQCKYDDIINIVWFYCFIFLPIQYLQHLLIAQDHDDCYCMPLTDKDVQDIQQKVGLDNLEVL